MQLADTSWENNPQQIPKKQAKIFFLFYCSSIKNKAVCKIYFFFTAVLLLQYVCCNQFATHPGQAIKQNAAIEAAATPKDPHLSPPPAPHLPSSHAP
jgi:hypothetical protein